MIIKRQQTKMLVTYYMFGDLFLVGLVSCSILQFRQNIIKAGSKSWLLTCSSNITFSLPSYTGSALKRGLNFCNSYLSLLYFCLSIFFTLTSFSSSSSTSEFFVSFSFWESMIKIFYDKKKNRCSVYKNKKNDQH